MQFSSHAFLRPLPHHALSANLHRPRQAFTLIELLICVSIIVLLLTLLVPAVQKARYAAMAGACSANLHRIALGTLLYTENSLGVLPSSIYGVNDTFARTSLDPNQDKVQTQSYTCPRTINDPLYANGIQYGSNMFILGRLANMSIPAATVLAGDDGGWQTSSNQIKAQGNSNGGDFPLIVPSLSLATGNYSPDFDGLHSGAGNVAWYDGHVSRETPMIPAKLPAGFPAIDNMPVYHYGYLTPVPVGTTYNNFANTSKTPVSATDYYFWFTK
jgi:prepilin-type N-terminal cleavage/methylation domain-containing protein/prepilin-type processing-associated H-X9-DG protein